MKKGLFIWSLFIFIFYLGCGNLSDSELIEKAKELENQQEFFRAVEQYEKCAELYPESPLAAEALYRAGLVYINMLSDSAKGISSLKRVVQEYAGHNYAALSQFMVGFIYANTFSDTAQARIEYNLFLQNYPDHELVPSVEWELKYLGKDINNIPELSVIRGGNQE
ncbi:tetratricopeptide repeat protein [bacterium]|nr:tetratricopeptide repeat protein [bacterium]